MRHTATLPMRRNVGNPSRTARGRCVECRNRAASVPSGPNSAPGPAERTRNRPSHTVRRLRGRRPGRALPHDQPAGPGPARGQYARASQRRGTWLDRGAARNRHRIPPARHAAYQRRQRRRSNRTRGQHGVAFGKQADPGSHLGGDGCLRPRPLPRRIAPPAPTARPVPRQSHAATAAGSAHVLVGRVLRGDDPDCVTTARSRDGEKASSGRTRRTPSVSLTAAMPASPAAPLPRRLRIRTVSAWSPAWWPSSRSTRPASQHAADNAA